MSLPNTLQEILNSNDKVKIKSLFAFDTEEAQTVIFKFNLWARYFFPKYFDSPDADFHQEIDETNLAIYRGELNSFVDIAFRGAAKTARTKLFLGYCITNDLLHTRKYIKVLSADGTNSKQIVTDIYNMFVQPKVKEIYPEIFTKTAAKREETMSAFTTATGIKVLADTVGSEQRGAIQEETRPDLIWFEDFENRKTLRSAVITKAIWDNMEEARTGLAVGGGAIYTANYISERGNVHILITRESKNKKVLLIPILKDGKSTWETRYSLEAIEQMRQDDDDFEGERLCQPSASLDVMFDRENLDRMEVKQPVKVTAGFKIFKEYNPSHRFGSGHDVAGGVGLDSSTSAFIDFSVLPNQVVATFKSNTIKPDSFGDEVVRESDIFGGSIIAVEKNNHGHATIARAKQLNANQYYTQGKATQIGQTPPKEYGWHTNPASKPKMMFDLVKAVDDGHLLLNDESLIAEAKSYTRDDLMDTEVDPRLTTRHFDLLIACAIAYQMKDYARIVEKVEVKSLQNWQPSSEYEGEIDIKPKSRIKVI